MDQKLAILMGTRGSGWWPIAATNNEDQARKTSTELNLRAGAGTRPGTLATMVVMVDMRDMELVYTVGDEIVIHRVQVDDGEVVEETLYSVPFSESSDQWVFGVFDESVDLMEVLGDETLGKVFGGSNELFAATEPSWDPSDVLDIFRAHLEAREA